MKRLNGKVLGLTFATVALLGAARADIQDGVPADPLLSGAPPFVPLELHAVEQSELQGGQPIAMPGIVRQGVSPMPDQQQIRVPAVTMPARPDTPASMAPVGKSGTGFFVGQDGTLLTAAHVAADCQRLQVMSRYLPRAWVSLVAMDRSKDIALLKATGTRPPAVLRLSANPPSGQSLMTLGFPAGSSQVNPAVSWVTLENQRIPASIGTLGNPRELLWMSGTEVSHGYSGGPIFDPRQGAVVGMIKGEVGGGYLRLVRDMPTTGVTIGPGVGTIGTFLRREGAIQPVAVAAPSGAAGEEMARRATVRVLCWQ